MQSNSGLKAGVSRGIDYHMISEINTHENEPGSPAA